MSGFNAYQETAVTTQNQGRLVVLLYEGAIKFCKLAIKELEAENYEAKGRYINRACDIIQELDTVLDMEAGQEVAANLHRLYDFMYEQLSLANMHKDTQQIREVIELLEELNDGWKAITQ